MVDLHPPYPGFDLLPAVKLHPGLRILLRQKRPEAYVGGIVTRVSADGDEVHLLLDGEDIVDAYLLSTLDDYRVITERTRIDLRDDLTAIWVLGKVHRGAGSSVVPGTSHDPATLGLVKTWFDGPLTSYQRHELAVALRFAHGRDLNLHWPPPPKDPAP